MPHTDRRRFLGGVALFAALPRAARAQTRMAAAPLPPPQFTLSVNLELMFPRTMPFEERLAIVAAEKAKAYSFWGFANKDLDKLRALADKNGMTCASITGANKTGFKSGLTKTGREKEFLDDFRASVKAAKKVGAENLITFVGETQPDVPSETQYAQIIAGLKKAGDIAGEAGVYLTLEPLSAIDHPQMSVLTATRGFAIVRDVAHPHVKLDFDLYHLQMSEGNLTNNLKEGLAKNYIRFVEVGDVPGRFEPGTGEVNYAHLFGTLRALGYTGYVGMEHRASTTPQNALAVVRKLAGVAA